MVNKWGTRMQADPTATTAPLRALIVHAHPDPESFSSAQMRAAAGGLSEAGYNVQVIDLYREAFEPVLDRGEFGLGPGRFKPAIAQERAYTGGTLAEDVKSHLDMLMKADLLVLSFPLWWYSTPAILKGWLDRVFIPGAVYSDEMEFETAALHGARARLLVTTGVEAERYGARTSFGAIDDLLLPLTRSLEYVGLAVGRPVVTWRPTRLTPKVRRERLLAVASQFREPADQP